LYRRVLQTYVQMQMQLYKHFWS